MSTFSSEITSPERKLTHYSVDSLAGIESGSLLEVIALAVAVVRVIWLEREMKVADAESTRLLRTCKRSST
jgi:hypothetical protein